MFEICTPISHLFKDKKFGKSILKYSNSLEAREHFEELNNFFSNKIKLFHFDIDLNLAWDDQIKKTIYYKTRTKKKLKLITFQMGKNCEKAQICKGVFKCISKSLNEDAMLSNTIKNVNWLKNKFKNINFGVENNNFLLSSAYKIVTNPDFISKVVNKNKIFFLLDIAHAEISSFNYKISFQKYFNKLPMNKAIQLHLCRPLIGKNLAMDKHYLPRSSNINKCIKIINDFQNIRYLTLEYYRNKKKLINCLKQLNMIQRKNV